MPELNRLIEILNNEPSMKIEIQGHTDDQGRGDAYNLNLSTNRAIFVQKHLISQGIAENRLGVKGFGLTKPIFPNTTEANRKKNRRVTFVIVP
jgi:outer membrane protein OmpA-like peptidoglycan-associated protein